VPAHWNSGVITRYNTGPMRIRVRRVGNSLGILLPKWLLDSWEVGEGGELELGEPGIRPVKVRHGFSRGELDELRRLMALAVVRRHTPREIRAQILANLHRWKQQGAWGPAYEEWLDIASDPDDGRLFAAMLGSHEEAARMRQSAPFVGLLPKEEVRRLNEEAAG
jgi:antitoxin component of MazEF toxin-antitoxin module